MASRLNCTILVCTLVCLPRSVLAAVDQLGICINAVNDDQAPARSELAALGARWVRTIVYQNDLPRVAEVATRYADLAQVLVILNSESSGEAPPGNDDDAGWSGYVDRFASFARSYAAQYDALIGAYEIWNEPDLVGLRSDRFAALLAATYPRLREVTAKPIISGGLAGPSWPSYLSEVAAALGGQDYDGVGFHPYGQRADGHPRLDWGFGELREVVATAFTNGGGKPVWITEFGVPTEVEGTDGQAEYLRRAYAIFDELGAATVAHAFWFAWDDRTHYAPQSEHFGLVDLSHQPRPAWTQYQSLAGARDAGQVATDAATPGDRAAPPADGGCTVSACAVCVVDARTDLLPFYAGNGWDVSCNNWDSIVADWCTIDATGCSSVKAGSCAGPCATTVPDAGGRDLLLPLRDGATADLPASSDAAPADGGPADLMAGDRVAGLDAAQHAGADAANGADRGRTDLDTGSGCACSSRRGSPFALWSVVMLVALAGQRRRRTGASTPARGSLTALVLATLAGAAGCADGCGGDPDGGPDAAAGDAVSADGNPRDGGRRDVPAFDLDRDAGQRDALVAFDARLESGALVPATSASFGADFRFNSAGRGTARVGDIAIGDNRTALQLAGVDHVGLSWRQLDWSAAGYQLYFELTLASDGSDLAVSWLYCSDDAIDYVYSESFELPLAWEVTSGTCIAQIVDQSVDVSLPPLRQLPRPFESGFSIQGSDIALAGTAGSIVVDGTSWALLPFETVDCTDCPGGPWYELHAMIHRPAEACFVILYLYPEKPEQIPLDYGICLPSLAQLAGLYDAVWSGRPLPSSYRPGSTPGEPPMRPPPRRHAPVKP